MKFRDIFGRVQKTIARWNQSRPEADASTASDTNPEVTEAVLRALYGRFIYINVGLNRKGRRALYAQKKPIPKGNVRNTPIKVYRENDGKNGIVKYSLITNPYFVPRVIA